jgi:hypothetical protein
MTHRIRRGALVVALIAGLTTTSTLFDVSPASAAAVPFAINTGGSTGTVFIDAFWGSCGGTSPDGGVSGYDAAWDWSSAGLLTPRLPWTQAPTNVPTSGPGCGSAALSLVRLELYPSRDTYDPWVGNFGGANSQRTSAADGAGFANFGTVSIPTLGQVPTGGAYPGFRMTGGIMTSAPGVIPDNRLRVDLFQVPCFFPDVCVQPPITSTGAYVGAFTTGKSKGNQWTGSIAWPGRYQVYIKDCLTGWTASNTCSVGTREVVGFVDIADGAVPTWDLDASCFGILNCQYQVGGPPTATGGFHPLAPTRILDTRAAPVATVGITNGAIRNGDGRLPTNFNPVHRVEETKNHDLKVTGVGGIPAYGVSAVLLNVTAVQPPGGDWLSVFPRPPSFDIYNNQGTYGANPPATTSNLNMTMGETAPNLVLAPVGAGGTIRFWNAGAFGMHVIADVAGWFDTGAPETSPGGLRFTGIAPDRLLDTRNGIGDSIGRFMPGDDRALQVTGIPNVPADAQSVVINITSAGPTGTGFITAYPSLTPVPNASHLNVNPGITRSNLAVVKVGADKKIRLAVFETDMDLIVDIFGYYSNSGGLTTAVTPVRVVDTRDGTGTTPGRFGPGETRSVKVTGVAGIPSNATAVMINVTAAETTSWGYLTVWPGGPQPSSSSLNWPGGKNTPNMVIVGVSATGHISIFNALGQAAVIVDVFGYVTP